MYHSWVYTINTAAGSRKGEASVASPAALTIDNIRSLYMVDDLFKTDKQMQDEITLKILSRLLENYQVSSDPTVSLQKLLQGETATNTLGLLASNIAAVETVAGEAKTAAE